MNRTAPARWLGPVGAVVFTAAVIGYGAWARMVLDPDACVRGMDAHLWLASATAMGRGDPRLAIEMARQPVYPGLVALLSLLGVEVTRGGWMVSLGAFGTLVGALFWFGVRWFGPLAGLVAAVSVMFVPDLLAFALSSAAESVMLLVFFAMAVAMAESLRRPGLGGPAAVGGLAAFGAMVKGQAMLGLPFGLLAALLRGGSHKQRLKRAVALVVMFLVVGMPWRMVKAAHPTRGHESILLDDVIKIPANEAKDNLVHKLRNQGWEDPGLRSSVPSRVVTLVWINIQRESLALAEARYPLFVPLALWLAWRRREEDPDGAWRVAGLTLAGVSMAGALPLLWQARHLTPFMMPMALVSGAGVQWAAARASDKRLAGLAVAGVVGFSALPALWEDVQAYRGGEVPGVRKGYTCSAGTVRAGRWIREHADWDGDVNVLAQWEPVVGPLTGLYSSNPWPDPFFHPEAYFTENPDSEVAWMVVSEHGGSNFYWMLSQRMSINPAAERVYTTMESVDGALTMVEVWRLDVAAAAASGSLVVVEHPSLVQGQPLFFDMGSHHGWPEQQVQWALQRYATPFTLGTVIMEPPED